MRVRNPTAHPAALSTGAVVQPFEFAHIDPEAEATALQLGHIIEAELPKDFDPSAHTVTEVLDALTGMTSAQAERVISAEAAGKKRSGILDHKPDAEETA